MVSLAPCRRKLRLRGSNVSILRKPIEAVTLSDLDDLIRVAARETGELEFKGAQAARNLALIRVQPLVGAISRSFVSLIMCTGAPLELATEPFRQSRPPNRQANMRRLRLDALPPSGSGAPVAGSLLAHLGGANTCPRFGTIHANC
jgi:hypothetical protein